MAQYAVSNQNGGTPQALTTTYKTSLGINAATGATTLRRGWIYEFEIGASSVPNSTDCPIQYDISVMTAAGTGTAAPAQAIDIGGSDAAALLTYTANYTVEPATITANSSLFNIALNQRASQRWIARDQSSCIIVPAVNLKGPVFRGLSPNYTGTISVQTYVQE
jgi:hypothetical protein